jgi:predicted transcriptional regulator
VNRDLKNVQEDLRLLEEYGLVRMTKGRSVGKRGVRVPEAPFNEIALKIAI